MKSFLISTLCLLSFGVYSMENLGKLEEIQFPATDLKQSTEFYEKLGYKVSTTEDWGFVQLKRGDNETVALITSEYQKEISLSYKSSDVLSLKSELTEKGIKLESDRTDSTRVKTLSFRDPSGNLIFVYQARD